MSTRVFLSYWSEAELDALRYLLDIYGHRRLNYTRVARLFDNRTPADVRYRATCIRDLARRRKRRAERRVLLTQAMEPVSSTSVVDQLLPPEGRLHPEVLWTPPTLEEIGQVNL